MAHYCNYLYMIINRHTDYKTGPPPSGPVVMQSPEVNGIHLSYVEAGQGTPVVFVHGSLEDLRIWRHQVEAFAGRYHVLAYSRRYHHPNAGPSDDGPAYSAAQHADDLAQLILKLHLAPAHLVTSSFGGCVVLQMAMQRPDLVRSMVLAEPPLIPWLLHIPGGAPLAADFLTDAWEPAQQAFRQHDFEQGVRLFHGSVMGHDAFDLLSPAGQRMIMDNAAEMRAKTLSNNFFPSFTSEDTTRIDRPALLLNGELSPRLFHMIIDELARCLPRATKAVIPHAPHVVHVGNPTAYNAAVLKFLEQEKNSGVDSLQ